MSTLFALHLGPLFFFLDTCSYTPLYYYKFNIEMKPFKLMSKFRPKWLELYKIDKEANLNTNQLFFLALLILFIMRFTCR